MEDNALYGEYGENQQKDTVEEKRLKEEKYEKLLPAWARQRHEFSDNFSGQTHYRPVVESPDVLTGVSKVLIGVGNANHVLVTLMERAAPDLFSYRFPLPGK